ncbi:Hypothetical predicted protein, partial [Pelobates cultripes]
IEINQINQTKEKRQSERNPRWRQPGHHVTASDGLSDQDSICSKYSESPVTEYSSSHKMLQELHAIINADFYHIDRDIRKEISNLGDRTSHLENRELCAALNEVVDKVHKLAEEDALLRSKMAYMEDRSKLQNVRFHSITDDVSHDALPTQIISICKSLIPELPDLAWAFDRMHRLPHERCHSKVPLSCTQGCITNSCQEAFYTPSSTPISFP